jgi:hypothetical protein
MTQDNLQPVSYQSPAPPPNSNLAIVSLVAGIACWVILPVIAAIAAVICGHMAKNEIRSSGGRLSGDGFATAGLILGYVNLAAFVLTICLGLVLPLMGISMCGICGLSTLPFANGINP